VSQHSRMSSVWVIDKAFLAVESLAESLESAKLFWVGTCSLLLLGVASLRALSRPLWYDEIFTFYISRLSSFSEIWSALSQGVDQQPPLVYLVTRVFQMALGSSEYVTRLPALLGFWLMIVCVFWFVSRRTNALYGAVAALFPMVTDVFMYAYEARPYGMVLGFSALAFLCWQCAADGRHRRLALVGLFTSVVLVVSSHYYAVLVLLPLTLGEITRIGLRRRVDWPMLFALAGATPCILLFLPLIRGAIELIGKHPWNPPTWGALISPYSWILGDTALPLGVVFMLLLFLGYAERRGQIARPACLPLPEAVAVLTFIALPVPAFVIARFGTNMIHARYLLPVVIGLAVLFTCAIYQVTAKQSLTALVLTGLLAGRFLIAKLPVSELWKSPGGSISGFISSEEERFRLLPLVFDNPHQFILYFHYGNKELRARATYVADPAWALHYLGMDAVDQNLRVATPFFSLPTVSWERFRTEHQQFLLAKSYSDRGWILQKLRDERGHIELVSPYPSFMLFFVTLGPPPSY
jgi:hypothetical protein